VRLQRFIIKQETEQQGVENNVSNGSASGVLLEKDIPHCAASPTYLTFPETFGDLVSVLIGLGTKDATQQA